MIEIECRIRAIMGFPHDADESERECAYALELIRLKRERHEQVILTNELQLALASVSNYERLAEQWKKHIMLGKIVGRALLYAIELQEKQPFVSMHQLSWFIGKQLEGDPYFPSLRKRSRKGREKYPYQIWSIMRKAAHLHAAEEILFDPDGKLNFTHGGYLGYLVATAAEIATRACAVLTVQGRKDQRNPKTKPLFAPDELWVPPHTVKADGEPLTVILNGLEGKKQQLERYYTNKVWDTEKGRWDWT